MNKREKVVVGLLWLDTLMIAGPVLYLAFSASIWIGLMVTGLGCVAAGAVLMD